MQRRPPPRWTFSAARLFFCPLAGREQSPGRRLTFPRECNRRFEPVAHSLSAKKRIRQSIKRRARNRARKEDIKESVKSFAAALTAGAFDKAETALREIAKR